MKLKYCPVCNESNYPEKYYDRSNDEHGEMCPWCGGDMEEIEGNYE